MENMENKFSILRKQDMKRYKYKPSFYISSLLFFLRKSQMNNNIFYRIIYRFIANYRNIEISYFTNIGGGLYLGHAYNITINPKAIIGSNCNIHKGICIGQENRGKRKGTPIIGNRVWIGINAVIVGKIIIGDDVLIAPNSYVNCDVPSHSVVYGNPCVIKSKDNATEGYINNYID